jgi:tight adherence protein B
MATMTLLLPLAAFVAIVAIALVALGATTSDRQALQERLAGYDDRRPTPKTASILQTQNDVLKQPQSLGIPLLQGLPFGSDYAARVSKQLAAAGVPLRVGEYLLVRWLCCVALAVLPFVIDRPWFLCVPLALFGFYLPKLYVGRKIGARMARFNDQLGDALVMMSNALRSGASFLQAIDLVAREMPAPIGEEFGLVVAEAAVGAPVGGALNNLTDRIKSYDLYIAVTAIMVQRQTGGSLSEVLETIAATIRDRAKLLRQVQVLTGEVRLSGYVVGLLPVGLLVALQIMTPSYYADFFTMFLGKLMIGAAFVLQILGFLAMQKVAQIDV